MRWSWIALGAGAYLAFAVATFPARTAYHWFAPEPLRLSGIEGTAWSGGAALGSVPGLALRELRWKVDALPLLLGRLAGTFEARLADGFVSAAAVATPGRVRLENVRASTRLATLRDLLPLPIGDPVGQVSLSLGELVLEDGWPVNAVGTLRIAQLAVPPLLSTNGGELVEVGNFTVEFTDTGGEGIVGTLRDDGGPLEVADGSVSLGLDRRYVLRGLARPRAEASEALVQGVGLMAQEPDAQGMYPIEFIGSL